MKKVLVLLSAALLVTGVTFAQDKDQKKKCAKGKTCCKKKSSCSKDKEEKSEKTAEMKSN
jgi:hypothetical protein